MKKRLIILIYIDALKINLITEKYMTFLSSYFNRHYYRVLENVVGYSFAIQSSMLSGKYPDENLHWMPYYYSPSESPLLFRVMANFGSLIKLDYLPLLRYGLERSVREIFIKKGVQINNTPFSLLDKISFYPYYYMNELPFYHKLRQLLFNEYGVKLTYIGPPQTRGKNIYKLLLTCSRKSLEAKTEVMLIYEDLLDRIGHKYGPLSREYIQHATYLDKILMKVHEKLENSRHDVTFLFFSDHGQSQFLDSVDIISVFEKEGLKFAKHYICFIDATIALFWPKNSSVNETMKNVLTSFKVGTLIDEKMRRRYHLNFKDKKRYGDLIYILRPGWAFFPNFFSPFGVMKGLHGYLPENDVQKAFILSDENLSDISHVKDIRKFVIRLCLDGD
ncbi:MAG: alkaline phosphatase family protein [Promethearchaeota archaeon]